jgi:hypothetical protein
MDHHHYFNRSRLGHKSPTTIPSIWTGYIHQGKGNTIQNILALKYIVNKVNDLENLFSQINVFPSLNEKLYSINVIFSIE